MKQLLLMMVSFLLINPAFAIKKASEKRLDEVAERGSHVMPFGLNLTTHVFTKTNNGGVQKVLVKKPGDSAQIKLIREHLLKISRDFQQANYSDPTKIHSKQMPGLAVLKNAKPNEVSILYADLTDGAQIIYSTTKPTLITAIHRWFDAQLSDHARHAVAGHSAHNMHHH